MTDANGVITVTLSTAADLKDANNTTVRLVPTDASGGNLTSVSIGGTTVGGFKCGPGATNGIDTKYLPGSCKS
jgi:type IV pilus assembly protein PilA